jgi:hypothetical protein
VESILGEPVKAVGGSRSGTLSAADCVIDTTPPHNTYISHLIEEPCAAETFTNLGTPVGVCSTLFGSSHESLDASDSPHLATDVKSAAPSLISQETRHQFMEAYDSVELELAEDLAYACASCM